MIKLGINGSVPAATAGAFQIYATADGVEIQDPSGDKININDLYNLANGLQLHIFGSGFPYLKFSDLPSRDVPVGAYAVDSVNGFLYRSAEHEGRIAWIPQEAYFDGSGFSIDAHINGDEADLIDLMSTSKIHDSVVVGNYDLIFTGSGVVVDIGKGSPLDNYAGINLTTYDLSGAPNNYDELTKIWVVCELEVQTLTGDATERAIFPVYLLDKKYRYLVGSFEGSNIEYYTFSSPGSNIIPLAQNDFWKTYHPLYQGEANMYLLKKGSQSTIDTYLNGQSYLANPITDFTEKDLAVWEAGLHFSADVGSNFKVKINKFTVITRS